MKDILDHWYVKLLLGYVVEIGIALGIAYLLGFSKVTFANVLFIVAIISACLLAMDAKLFYNRNVNTVRDLYYLETVKPKPRINLGALIPSLLALVTALLIGYLPI